MGFWTVFWTPKGARIYSFLAILGATFAQNPKKGIEKGMQKIVSKKYRKLMPEACKNDTKMDAKIDEILYFSEKG